MARNKSRTPTIVELEFLQVLWAVEEITTEQVREVLRRQGRRRSDGTVRKVLSILMAKGYVSRRPEGRGFLYRAKVPRDRANRRMVEDLLQRAFGGTAALMVAALLDARTVGDKDMQAIKQLIAERERGEKR